MKKICPGCKQEKFIISGELCSGCFMKQKFNVPDAQSTKTTELREPDIKLGLALELPVIVAEPDSEEDNDLFLIAPSKPQEYNCDSCGTSLPKDFKRLKSLKLCEGCFKTESEAAAQLASESKPVEGGYKSWPKCSKCGAYTKDLPADTICKQCKANKKTVDIIAMNTTDSNKYQQFFNQVTEELTNMSIEDIREFIIQTDKNIFSKEADLLRERTRKQGAQVKFNAILEKMSLEDRNRLKITDDKFVAVGAGAIKKLANPLKQIEKKKKVKESLQTTLTALFGDKLTPEEIAERMKKLGI